MWCTRQTPIKHIATKPIIVFTAVLYKDGQIVSTVDNHKYHIGQINRVVGDFSVDEIKDSDNKPIEYRICNGFENHHMKNVHIGNGSLFIDIDGGGIIVTEKIASDNNTLLMKCEIPIGSEYYINEHGLVTSNSIVPQGVYPISKLKETEKITDIPFLPNKIYTLINNDNIGYRLFGYGDLHDYGEYTIVTASSLDEAHELISEHLIGEWLENIHEYKSSRDFVEGYGQVHDSEKHREHEMKLITDGVLEMNYEILLEYYRKNVLTKDEIVDLKSKFWDGENC